MVRHLLPGQFSRRKGRRSRLNRRQSPLRMKLVPAASVVLASLVVMIVPIFPATPLVPPLGLLFLTAWLLLRPGLWPLWAGFLFGLIDDIFSGQPIGSSAFIWSLVMVFLHLTENRLAGRTYLQDWLIGSVVLIFGIAGGWAVVGLAHSRPDFIVLVPQLAVSILSFPLVIRLTAALDSWRLSR